MWGQKIERKREAERKREDKWNNAPVIADVCQMESVFEEDFFVNPVKTNVFKRCFRSLCGYFSANDFDAMMTTRLILSTVTQSPYLGVVLNPLLPRILQMIANSSK
jgi:hypothetical protein